MMPLQFEEVDVIGYNELSPFSKTMNVISTRAAPSAVLLDKHFLYTICKPLPLFPSTLNGDDKMLYLFSVFV